MEKRQSHQSVVLGNWIATCKRMKLEHFLTSYIKHLNVKPETIKLLKENTGKILYDTDHCSTFFLGSVSYGKRNESKNEKATY